jgi:Na+-transporting NADH:ubiquinone oxidoreductase subunit NqrF
MTEHNQGASSLQLAAQTPPLPVPDAAPAVLVSWTAALSSGGELTVNGPPQRVQTSSIAYPPTEH